VFKEYAKLLEARANGAIKTEEGDYVQDGLLYCGKCNTPKQKKVEIMDMVIFPKILCKCEAERRDREEEAEKKKELAERIKKYRKMGFPQSQMEHWTFENDDKGNEKLTNMAKRYVDNFNTFCKDGKGLLFYGGVGTGKTYIACMIANALIDKGYPVLVTNFARILSTLQGTFDKQEYLDSLNKFRLLIIDDLGIERDTGYAKEQVFNIIDSRYRAGLPMIITTNLTMQKLATESDLADKRVYDRILERCYPVEVAGESRRMKKLLNSRDDMKNILGI
jgi:DNA replication protein DnaC